MLLPNDHITQTCVTRPRFYNSRFLRLIIIISHLMHLTLRQLRQVGINAKNKNLSLQGSGDHGSSVGVFWNRPVKFFPTFERHDSWSPTFRKGKGYIIYQWYQVSVDKRNCLWVVIPLEFGRTDFAKQKKCEEFHEIPWSIEFASYGLQLI